jgi:hypothetical protein
MSKIMNEDELSIALTGGEDDDTAGDPLSDIKLRIIAVLQIYPKLNASMLQVGIGPHIKPQKWRPALEALVSEGVVERTYFPMTTPGGTYRTISVLSLNPVKRAPDLELREIDARQLAEIQDVDDRYE